MSQPVKLSDDLILEARVVAKAAERSIAGQIEFWARLGRAVEPLLNSQKALSLKQAGEQRSLSSLFASIDLPEGANRLSTYLSKQPFPHYEAAEGKPGILVRIDESGVRTLGRFVNRKFEPVKTGQTRAVRSNASEQRKSAAARTVGRKKRATK